MAVAKSYLLLDHGRAIKCLVCNKVSYHPEDVKNLYCGFCHISHELREKMLELDERAKLTGGRS